MDNDTAGAQIVPADLLRAAWDAGQDFASYAEWVLGNGDALRRSHGEAMNRLYADIFLSDKQRETVERITSGWQILAIVDVGCPDVVANLPIFAAMAEMSPTIALRIVHQPEHLDLALAVAEAYPGTDGLAHVPTYILLDKTGEIVDVLLERPDAVTPLTARRKAAAYREWHRRFPGVAARDLPEDYKLQFFHDYNIWRRGLLALESAAVVDWLSGTTMERG